MLQAAARDILEPEVLEFLHGCPADNTPICHAADLLKIEAMTQAIHYKQQGLGNREVTRPRFATKRLSFSVQDDADDHLPMIWSMVLEKVKLAQTLTTLTSKGDTGGIKTG